MNSSKVFWIGLLCYGLAQAGTPLSDADLAQVAGANGIFLSGSLNVKAYQFMFTDTDLNGGTLSLNQVKTTGMFVKQYDILQAPGPATSLSAELDTPGSAAQMLAKTMQPYLGESGAVHPSSQTYQQLQILAHSGLNQFDSDILLISYPNIGLSSSIMPTWSVQSITMGSQSGGLAPSFGSLTLRHIDFQGSSRAVWAH